MTATNAPHARAATSPWRARARVAEAMALLAFAGAAQRWLPMKRWTSVIGQPAEVPADWAGQSVEALPTRSADLTEDRVRRAIRSGARHLPWTPSCLAEAATAQVMLRQRGTAGVLVIGLRPGESAAWGAHAWLLGSRGAITGAAEAVGFTPTTVFEVPGRLRAADIDLS